ncbi:MAG TPA: hypothetical protein VJ346_08205, partial [Bacteroidales bacterium]|nr:hypothetical protein [Bacteroidales bacterium]
FVISIDNVFVYDSTGQAPPDPRDDERIVAALAKYKQFHCGLKCTIDTVIPTSSGLTLKFTIANDDSFNYYVLSPDKTGIALFHYFTNGLRISDDMNHQSYGHHIGTLQPDPYDSWNKEWFYLIRRNEKKSFTLFYDQFDVIPKGQYNASFRFPGLSYQVKNKKDLNGEDGRIWLGDIDVKKKITIN